MSVPIHYVDRNKKPQVLLCHICEKPRSEHPKGQKEIRDSPGRVGRRGSDGAAAGPGLVWGGLFWKERVLVT